MNRAIRLAMPVPRGGNVGTPPVHAKAAPPVQAKAAPRPPSVPAPCGGNVGMPAAQPKAAPRPPVPAPRPPVPAPRAGHAGAPAAQPKAAPHAPPVPAPWGGRLGSAGAAQPKAASASRMPPVPAPCGGNVATARTAQPKLGGPPRAPAVGARPAAPPPAAGASAPTVQRKAALPTVDAPPRPGANGARPRWPVRTSTIQRADEKKVPYVKLSSSSESVPFQVTSASAAATDWGDNPDANCYAYAWTTRNNNKLSPGQAHDFYKGCFTGSKSVAYDSKSSASFIAGAVADGMTLVGTDFKAAVQAVKPGYYLVAGFRGTSGTTNGDHHWYRRHPDGTWSHKPGLGGVSTQGSDGKAITDTAGGPEEADRSFARQDAYQELMGYFLVPEGGNSAARKFASGQAKSGCCFLTTACVEAMGLPDDCHELTTLRAFRDEHLSRLPGGPALIDEYYEVAPAILDGIREQPDPGAILRDLHGSITRTVELVEAGAFEDAIEGYRAMVLDLKARFAAS